MQKIAGEIEDLGGVILVVSFAPPEQVAAFLRDNPQPFPMVSDPNREAYRAFELGATSIARFFRPSVLWRFWKLILRGWLPKKPAENADLLQLGGDFVLDRGGAVIYAHRSVDAADRPSKEVLLDEMRKAVAA